MKKVRIFLSVLAVVLAVGGTFAAQYEARFSITGYEYVPGGGLDPDACIERSVDCDTTGPNLCTFNSHKVGDASTISTQCGVQLRHP